MASIKRIEYKNGRIVYRIVISLGYDTKGNKVVKNLTYSVNQNATPKQQEKEALKYAMDMEDKIKYGHDLDASKTTFESFAEKWLESVKSELSYGTFDNYRMNLKNKIVPYFKSYKMINIKVPLIEAYYKTLLPYYARGTIEKHSHILSGIFGTAVRWGVIESNPCREAKIPKTKDKEETLRYFTPQQSVMFLKSLELEYETEYKGHTRIDDAGKSYYVKGYKETRKVSTQHKVFYTLSIYCGFRRGETLALHWSDIDFDKREIFIRKAVGKSEDGIEIKKPKTKTSIRKVIFPEQILPLLKQYKDEYDNLRIQMGNMWEGNGNIFIREYGQLMGRSTPYQFFRKHLKRYNKWIEGNEAEAKANGFEALPIIPLHGLRHSCATLLNSIDVNIVDISEILGHAKSSTTMDIYAHSFEKQKRDVASKLGEFIEGQK